MRVPSYKKQHGFGLIEVVVSTLLVSLMLVGSLTALASFTKTQEQDSLEAQAMMLANSSLNSILSESYVNIEITTGEESPGLVEAVINFWVNLFNGSSSETVGENVGWDVQAEARYLTSDLTAIRDTDQGIKLVTVSVSKDGIPLQTIRAVITQNLD